MYLPITYRLLADVLRLKTRGLFLVIAATLLPVLLVLPSSSPQFAAKQSLCGERLTPLRTAVYAVPLGDRKSVV